MQEPEAEKENKASLSNLMEMFDIDAISGAGQETTEHSPLTALNPVMNPASPVPFMMRQ